MQPIPGTTVCAFCLNCFCRGAIKTHASDGKLVHVRCKEQYEVKISPKPIPKQ